jgi:hypothetical protein
VGAGENGGRGMGLLDEGLDVFVDALELIGRGTVVGDENF